MAEESRPRPVGIKDVAARAGVSPKTVTNVVHNRPNVAPRTRARVQEAIDALGYRPSAAGRVLQSGHSRTLALAVPAIDNPYIGALAHVIQAAAVERGYRVMIDETRGSAEAELDGLSGYPGTGVEAVIFEPFVRDRTWLTESSSGVPTVLLSDWVPDSCADTVSIDNEQSASDVVDLLVELGCRRLVLIGSQPHTPASVGEIRIQAARRAAQRHGLPQPAVIPLRDYSNSGGRLVARRYRPILDESDGVVCTSDLVAVGLIKQLTEDGVAIPDQLMVVGWDNIPDGETVEPSLTTVEPDRQALAAAVMNAAIERIEGHQGPARRILVPHRIVQRKSAAGSSPPGNTDEGRVIAPEQVGPDQPALSERERTALVEALTAWRIASFPSRETAVQLGFSGVGALIDTTAALSDMLTAGTPLTTAEWRLVRNASARMLEDRMHNPVRIDDPAGPFPTQQLTEARRRLDAHVSETRLAGTTAGRKESR